MLRPSSKDDALSDMLGAEFAAGVGSVHNFVVNVKNRI
jgi:hypothetical protein